MVKQNSENLILDVQNCKIRSSETIAQYSLRIETNLTRLQTDIAQSSHEQSEIIGRIASTEDLALHTFMLDLPSHIFTIVRCRNHSNSHEAVNLAIQEEKLFNYIETSSSYHPQTNGALERSHDTLKEYPKSYVNKNQNDWHKYLPTALISYNSTVHSWLQALYS